MCTMQVKEEWDPVGRHAVWTAHDDVGVLSVDPGLLRLGGRYSHIHSSPGALQAGQTLAWGGTSGHDGVRRKV